MRKRTILFAAYWFFAFMLVPFQCAWAYIDPATTTYIIQIAAAIVITLGVSFGVVLYKFQMIVTNLSVSVHAFMRNLGGRRNGQVGSGNAADSADCNRPSRLNEEQALAAGVIDYPIPVRETYPALAEYTPPEQKVRESTLDSEHVEKPGWLSRLGHWLWDDDRSFKNRLIIALAVASGVTMTFFVFSMLDSTVTNAVELSFTFGDVVGPVLLLGLVAFAAQMVLFLPLKGRVFDFAICFILSFLICGYLQSTYLNASLGKLIGLPLGWDRLGVESVLMNLLLWAAVFAVVFILGFVRKPKIRKFYKQFACFVPVLLVSIQLIALLSIIPSGDTHQASSSGEKPRRTLTTEHIYEVSSDENIIVITLDMFDDMFVNNLLAEDPHYFDNLDGFTRFTNYVTRYNETFPSVAFLITNEPYDSTIPKAQYMSEAFDTPSFISDIREEGFASNLYMEKWYTYLDRSNLDGITDNLDKSQYHINMPTVLKRLTRLSLLKSVPLALKEPFTLYSGDFGVSSTSNPTSDVVPYETDDFKYYEGLKSEGLKETGEQGRFTYLHLNGPHFPWFMDENVQYVAEGTTGEQQTKGSFLIVNEYLRQLKDLGLYKDATIIITGDHSTHMDWMQLEKPMLTALFVKPAGEEGTPLAYNNAPVTIENLRATCVAAAGGDPSPWGKTFFEVDENEKIVRYYYNRYTIQDPREDSVACYRITGDARDWANWELVEVVPYDPAVFNKDFWL